MRPKYVTITLAAADADGIFLSANPALNATLTPDGALSSGGIATMDVARRVLITSASDDTLVTFRVYGTNQAGIVIYEDITGSNASTVASTKDFKTVTSIVTTGNAGVITIGTNTQAATPWIPLDVNKCPFNVGFTVRMNGAAGTYTVQHTQDDVQDLANIKDGGALETRDHDTVASETTEQEGNYILPIRAMRLYLSAFTSGTFRLAIIQAGK